MNRRQLITLSGTALAAYEGVAFAQQTSSGTGTTEGTTARTLVKYNRARASYKIPKNEDKATRYVGSLSAALGLTIDQQQAASKIFVGAIAARADLHAQIKTARQGLSNVVIANDANAVSQAAAVIGTLKYQIIAAGANAHAAFYQLLNPDQQSRLRQYRS